MDMTMSSARPNRVEVVTSVQRRRRWTPEQKLAIVKQTNEPGSSVSLVARENGLTAAQLFQWRKAYFEGSLVAVGANETVVPASELQEAMKRINMLVKRLMADGQSCCNLLRTPLHAHQRRGFFPYPRLNGWGIATVLRTLCREFTGLFGSIAPRTIITNQLPADGGLVPIQQLGYLSLIVSGFHEGVNLISFSLAEVFVFHKQLRLPGQEALNAIHPQPPNHQLIKVALRA